MQALVNQKKIDIDFSKAKIKFCLSFYCNSDNNYLFVNGKEIYKFKASNKNVNFPSQFCLGSGSNKFDYVDSEELSFKENMYDVSVDYGSIEKSDILNIHKYLMIKISIEMFGIIKKMLIVVLSNIVNASNHTKFYC